MRSNQETPTENKNLEERSMSEMFCFQCEQTAAGTACLKSGVLRQKPTWQGCRTA
jgi:hypothetical protein